MIFRFMEKHRIGILLAILIAMTGFGFWGYLAEGLGGNGAEADVDQGKVVATFNLFGEKVDVTKEELEEKNRVSVTSLNDVQANAALATVIKERFTDADIWVTASDELVSRMIKEALVTKMATLYGQKIDEAAFTQLANNNLMKPQEYKAQLAADLNRALTFRELDRAGLNPTLASTFERYKKDFQLLKLKGIFWDSESYAEETKLARDKDGNLTQASEVELKKAWDALSDEDKQGYNKKFALIDVEFAGFDFERYKTDEEMTQAFIKKDEKSGKSLQELTKAFKFGDTEVAKMKLRMERNRGTYGLTADDDIEKVFESRKKRWTQEIKILKLVKKVHDDLMTAQRKGETIDYAKAAADNNLTYFKWMKRHVLDLREAGVAFQSVVLFGLNSTAVKPGDIFEYKPAMGPTSAWFFRGPVDQPGRFIASYHLLNRIDKPIPEFADDVKKDFLAKFEAERAEKKRDEAYDRFKAKMDAITEEKGKEEIAKIKEDTKKAIAEAIKDLDPEKDKDKIKEITDEQNEDADALIEAEKDKYRAEAFKKVITDNAGEDIGLIVTEGFFDPFFAAREGKYTQKIGFEDRARSSLRTEFSVLHDKGFRDEYFEAGEVSPMVESRSYKGLKGIAMIEAKQEPTLEEMLLHPNKMRFAEMNTRRSLIEDLRESSMWEIENLKKYNFDVDSTELEKQVEKNLARDRETEEGIRKYEEEQKRIRAAKAAAKAKAAEEANKNKKNADEADTNGDGKNK